MKQYSIVIENSKAIVGHQIYLANSFFSRFKGLMFKRELLEGEGLLLTETKQIHTFWMKIPIDVVYLKEISKGFKMGRSIDQFRFEIVGLDGNVKPGKVGKVYKTATHVLELKAGSIEEKDLKQGEIVLFVENN